RLGAGGRLRAGGLLRTGGRLGTRRGRGFERERLLRGAVPLRVLDLVGRDLHQRQEVDAALRRLEAVGGPVAVDGGTGEVEVLPPDRHRLVGVGQRRLARHLDLRLETGRRRLRGLRRAGTRLAVRPEVQLAARRRGLRGGARLRLRAGGRAGRGRRSRRRLRLRRRGDRERGGDAERQEARTHVFTL